MRYDTGELIGEGGFGEVYRAWDPELERHVAIKFLKSDEPALVARLQREAKAQAQIEHPNVCPVYEVGSAGARPYIAMAWIDGRPIDEVVPTLPLEERIALFLPVVEAVHAAHRVGLVHRDLKPANLLVETRDDGELVPWVLDFGVARIEGATGLTVTGQVVGTPGYLSPEQARGENDHLDRRSDLFSLGCVLFELLSGHRPFGEETGIDSILRVLRDDAPPLRRHLPNAPRELEAVLGKCLEREVERRYPSARELAEDLRRYLDGEPVRARPIGRARRLLRWGRRRPAFAAGVAVALLAGLVLVGVTLHQRAAARAEAELARRFGTEVERIRTTMLLAHLAAPHDVTADRERLVTRLDGIRGEMVRQGRRAEGPGLHALGRGYLVLGDLDRAEAALDQAWALGYRTPDMALARAELLGARYDEAREESERLRDPVLRAAALERARATHLEPALRLLRDARDREEGIHELVEARFALFEDRLDDAERLALRALGASPWLYEAEIVQAEVALRRSDALRRLDDLEGAEATLEDALAAATRAGEQGRSDPHAHETTCRMASHAMALRFFSLGAPLEDLRARVESSCGRALELDPGHRPAWRQLSASRLLVARSESQRGLDPLPSVAAAIAAADRLVGLEPDGADGLLRRGGALAFRAEFERERGGNAADSIRGAIADLEEAVSRNPSDPSAHNTLGLAYWEAAYQAEDGKAPPVLEIERAIEAFESATEILPDFSRAHSNLGAMYSLRSGWELLQGLDPTESFRRALAAYERAIETDPGYSFAYNNLGNVYRNRALHRIAHGEDPTSDFEEARRLFEEASSRNREWPFPWFNLGLAELDRARHLLLVGADTEAAVRSGVEAFERGLAMNAEVPDAWIELAGTQLVGAEAAIGRGDDAERVLRRAEEAVARAAEVGPDRPQIEELRATLWRLRGRQVAQTGADPLPHWHRGFEAAERAAAGRPEMPAPWEELTRLASDAGRWLLRRHRAPEAAAFIDRGLRAAQRLLEVNPTSAEARAMRGELLLLDPSAADREGQTSEALALVHEALAANRHLAHRYGALLDRPRSVSEQSLTGEGGS